MMNGVSLVICCYNSAERIPKVLEYLALQEINENISWEIVLVDNASQDNTAEIAKKSWNNNDVPLHIITEPQKGLSYARKTGIQHCSYNIVSFIDDDNWVNKDWIQGVYLCMKEHPKVAILGGRGEPVFENSPPSWFETFQGSFAVGPQAEKDGLLDKELAHVYGAGLSLRKDLWNMIVDKGFQFQLSGRAGKSLSSGEDSEMCLAVWLAGYDVWYDSKLTFKHVMPASRLSWKYLMKLARAFGKASVVIDIYKSIFMEYKGIARLKFTNLPMSIIHALYNVLLSLPVFLWDKLLLKRYTTSEYKLNFDLYNLLQKLKYFKSYGYYVDTIYSIKWKDEK